ncbi:MAG: hypothetical protein AB3N14_14610, partial [Flavobacteriaceae bacterium]
MLLKQPINPQIWTGVFAFLLILACKQGPNNNKDDSDAVDSIQAPDTLSKVKKIEQKVFRSLEGLADTTFVRLADFSDDFAYDLRYATTNNFL